MRIGFDAKKAVRNHTGIGNYSRRCLACLSRYAPGEELWLFVPWKKPALHKLAAVRQSIRLVHPARWGRGLLYELWRNFLICRAIRRSQIDLFHGLSNELPWGIRKCCKSVVTIHDLIFMYYPDTYRFTSRFILKWKTKHACRVADHIIAVSQQTKRDLIKWYNVPAHKISVVYQSIDERYFGELSAEQVSEVKEKYRLPSCYLLCVGTIEERKNQETLLRAMTCIDENVHLVIVGKSTPYETKLRRFITKNPVLFHRVHWLHGVTDEELFVLYREAVLCCYLSLYEGFGLPVAEALASGTPVIASSGSCLEEAGGNGAAYIAPTDYRTLAATVNELLANPERRDRMGKRGRDYVKRFNDESLACQLMKVYRRTLNAEKR